MNGLSLMFREIMLNRVSFVLTDQWAFHTTQQWKAIPDIILRSLKSEIKRDASYKPVQGHPKCISDRVNNCLKKQLVAGKWKCLKCSRISHDISMKIWEAVLKSWDIELFSDIGLISEHFVCYPLYHGKIKSYFGNFNRFISGIGRWKVLTSISCRFSLDISMKMSETCLKSWNSQLFNGI